MAAKKSTDVLIGGKVYTLSGYEEEDYLQQVATYINNKIAEIEERDDTHKLSPDMKATLIQINIADEFFKLKDRVEKFESEMDAKEEELYELKHDLISKQVRVEDYEKKIAELEAENKDLLGAKARLESSLEDVLLGSVDSDED